MSNSRQEDRSVLVRTFGVTFSRNQIVPPVRGDWDQLVYANKGVLTVKTTLGTWVVPPYRALWLPADTPSTLEVIGQTALRMLYLRRRRNLPKAVAFDRSKCAVLSVSPLLRELILRTVQMSVLHSTSPNHRRMAGLIEDEMKVVDIVPLQLPYPQSDTARRLASRIEASFDLANAIRECGASRRTMERVFRAETGMSLGQWVRRRKLLAGLQMLVSGETTANVAFELGYNGPSAFIAMFKKELGETPGNYLSANRSS
jgi:AraC-like DNA-binding protein